MFLIPLLLGCTAIALTGAGAGISYTLSNVAYRSFSSSVDRVHHATIAALKKMDIKIIDDYKTEDGRTITADTKELDIVINLEEVTFWKLKMKAIHRAFLFIAPYHYILKTYADLFFLIQTLENAYYCFVLLN